MKRIHAPLVAMMAIALIGPTCSGLTITITSPTQFACDGTIDASFQLSQALSPTAMLMATLVESTNNPVVRDVSSFFVFEPSGIVANATIPGTPGAAGLAVLSIAIDDDGDGETETYASRSFFASTSSPDCAGVCGGSATLDCLGACNGPAIFDNQPVPVCCDPLDRDCRGACFGPVQLDCTGVCGGSAAIDSLGACCDSSALDCANICNGGAQPDCLGTCQGPAIFDGVSCCLPPALDCAGVCNGGTAVDCSGSCGGTQITNCLGICLEASENLFIYDSFGSCCDYNAIDCAGLCDGTAVYDEAANVCCTSAEADQCGVCFGPGPDPASCPNAGLSDCGASLGQGACDGCGACVCSPSFFGDACQCESRTGFTTSGSQWFSADSNLFDLIPTAATLRTVELEFRATGTPGELVPNGTLISKGGNWAIRINGGELRVHSGGEFVAAATPIYQEVWTHVAVVFDAPGDGTMTPTIFVDGQLDAAAPQTINLGAFNTIDLIVGQALAGAYDEIRFWGVARSPAEIEATAFKQVDTDVSLRGYWRFDDSVTGPWDDFSYYTNWLNAISGAGSALDDGPEPSGWLVAPGAGPNGPCDGAGILGCAGCSCTNGEETPDCRPPPPGLIDP